MKDQENQKFAESDRVIQQAIETIKEKTDISGFFLGCDKNGELHFIVPGHMNRHAVIAAMADTIRMLANDIAKTTKYQSISEEQNELSDFKNVNPYANVGKH